jgi:hypothetical protein
MQETQYRIGSEESIRPLGWIMSMNMDRHVKSIKQ